MRLLALIFINLGLLLFILNWIIDREISWLGYYISEYVHTRHGLLTVLAFILAGVGTILSSGIFLNPMSLIDIELVIFGALFIFLGIFPVDIRGKLSWKGVVHTIIAHLSLNSFVIVVLIDIKLSNSEPPIYTLILLPLTFLSAILLLLLTKRVKGFFQRVIIFSELILIQLLMLNS